MHAVAPELARLAFIESGSERDLWGNAGNCKRPAYLVRRRDGRLLPRRGYGKRRLAALEREQKISKLRVIIRAGI